MKVSLKWFEEFFELNVDLKTMEDICLLRGVEIENITKKESILKNCYSGKILEISKLSENLNLCKVLIKGDIFNSVTSAKNVKKGDIVPVVINGGVINKTILKENGKERIPSVVKSVEIGGILSEAMLLSYDEIGIPEDSLTENYKVGIFILPPDTPVGENLVDLLWLNDTILDVKTYNRGDILSLKGLADEFERYNFGISKKKDLDIKKKVEFKKSDFEILIKNIELCPRYVGIIIKDVEVKNSSINNLRKLLSLGIRPVNNVVDWTNIIMYEYGQPLHAFDLDKIDTKIVVREAKPNEKIVTLDGKDRELEEGMLLICDKKSPIAIAGVIGGKDTEVTENTKNVFLESAYFAPYSISKTKRKLKIETEAGNRFEKGVDIEKTNLIGLMCALNFGGKEIEGPIDIYPKPYKKENIKLRFDRTRKILGINIKDEEIIDSLEKGGFEVVEKGEDYAVFREICYRPDVKSEIDLIEEVIRYHGIEKVKYSIPLSKLDSFEEGDLRKLKKKIRETLSSIGFYEVTTLSLLDGTFLMSFNINKKMIEVLNPLRNDQNVLRTSLIPSLIKIIEKNIKNGNKNLNIYEIGKIYFEENNSYNEIEEVVAITTGKIVDRYWGEKDKFVDFYYIKGALEVLLKELKILNYTFLNINPEFLFHPYRYGKIFVEEEEIGEIGEINTKILSNLSIEQKVYSFRLNLRKLLKFSTLRKIYEDIPKYPPLTFDISLIVQKDIKSSDILRIIKEEGKELLYKVNLFDVFEDEKIGKDKKSLAFSLIFLSNYKTLKDEDIIPIINRIEERIEKEYGGVLRKKVE